MDSQKTLSGWVWGLVLAALVFSSIYATQTITAHFQIMGFMEVGRGDNLWDEIIWFVGHGTVALLLVAAWRSFAELSHDWIVSIATGQEPFESLLIFSIEYEDKNDEGFEASDVETTSVSTILRLLGFAWGILIITPTLIPLILEVLQGDNAF
ncbi:MAG: hypothetical protein L0154_17375 [Chloroflexi bacterium]|nr:hypothetical protein [Chloroflexota bacterium]